jgi:membrane associated rhomboid family serine protease
MVLPLADDNSDRTLTPYVNYALIAINALVFVGLQSFGADERFTRTWSTVPLEIVTGKDIVTKDEVEFNRQTGEIIVFPGLQPTPISVYLTLITSMFMHGGIAHILGNMLFLWIFGDNIEDIMGHARYLAFYLISGVLASLAHVFSVLVFAGIDSQEMLIPSLGASGAISGVLGAYILLFPTRMVLVLLFRFLTWVPAYVAIGIWFAFQVIEGLGLLGGSQQGVAFGAHIGGFLAGLALVIPFTQGGPKTRVERAKVRHWPDSDSGY